MRTNIKPENRRLLNALDYLDDGVISSVLAEIKVPAEGSPERDKAATRRSIKYALALAACLVLMSAVIPVVSHLISNFPAGVPSDTTTTEDLPSYAEYAEYTLTKEDLAMMNAAWQERFGEDFAPTVEAAMKRTKYDGHYFGKYGDTVVIWRSSQAAAACIFSLGEYDFSFSTGQTWFFNDSKAYNQYEAAGLGLLNDEQIEALYKYYTDEYRNCDDELTTPDPETEIAIPEYTPPKTTSVPTYWDFLPDLEPLSREQMTEIREAYAKYTFADQYVKYCKQYIDRGENYDPISAYKNAESAAVKGMKALFSDNYYYSRYYGTFGDSVVVALVDYTLAATEYKLKDASIVFPQGAEMYVYRDGEITEFGEFYKSGSMSEEDALRLWYRHQIYESTSRSSFEYQDGSYLEPISGVEPLTRKQISKIRTAYANYVYNIVLDQYTADYITQYGEEEGRKQVLIKAGDASNAAIKSLFGDDLSASQYYGTIDGYVIFGIPAPLSFPEIPLSSGVSVYVYSFDYDMVFKYSPNMLSEDGVKKLEQRQIEYADYLLNESFDSIMERYFGQILYDDEHPLVFTHQTDRCMLICVKSGYEELKKYEIAGYEFLFPYGVNLYVGCNGETHSLYTAHQIGYITDADMAEIYEAYLDYCEEEKE